MGATRRVVPSCSRTVGVVAAAASAASVGGSAGSHQAAAPPSSEVDLDTYDVAVTYSHCEAPVCSTSRTLDDMVGYGCCSSSVVAVVAYTAMTFQKLANFRS